MKYFLIFLFSLTGMALAEHRVALLIENKNYKKFPLKYSENHLKDIEKKLKEDGFKVYTWQEKSKKDFERNLEEIVSVVPVNSTLLLYCSGYLQSYNYKDLSKNYLLTTDSDYKSDDDIGRRGLAVEKLFSVLQKRCGSRDKIVFLDLVTKYPDENIKTPGPMISMKVPSGTYIFSNVKPGESQETFKSAFSGYKNGTDKSVIEKIKALSSWSSLGENPVPQRDKAATKPLSDLSEAKKAGDEWVNEIGMVFCWCPPGTYTMGSPAGMPGHEKDQIPKEVTFKEGFWVSKYELTNLNYYKLRKRENTKFKVNLPNHPVITNHDEQRHMLKYLQEKAPAPSGWHYNYPTESEWEYFARAGSSDKYFFGNDESKLPLYANFADKSLFDLQDGFYSYAHAEMNDGIPKVGEVGQLKANPWGIHDVYGNVWEWCNTRYTTNRKLPTKKESKNGFVVKGGSWCSKKEYCHSAFRNSFEGRYESNFLGARLILKKK